ncbi:DNA polymerase III subunit delta' [Cohnella sp. CIP 111063]|jgi:DNA polymerase-3 subunit delta'|uniref:DNA polymerase III subunit delta' n=1 Tax=unclassified Cohnella TaxID=2636738 RepID=UPI000B8BDEA9|nr:MULTISPECIES: DNA polymerase III subunit delta' [unclassified Cohnella]OXS54741.1 DNA polymerase III subunit delta' [Cohnella sp. CIP 111063]PRX64578.1 DNA polymerase III delta prime subunit [Cohnella sp. SGD-V74]
MGFQQIAGQDRAKSLLRNALAANRLAHAYLFAGPPGSGRMEMAQAFAQAIFCERGGGDACGECLECRKVLHGNHPDLHVIQPDGATVKIEQIRSLQRELSYRSSGAGYKVYIIQAAETMTVQASNSLLKFLEEPPSPVVAILLAPSAQAVLPTILSRTQLVPFVPGDRQALENLLVQEGKSPLLARAAVHLSSGLSSSRKLVDENWFADIRNVVIQLGKESPSRFAASVLQAQQQVFKTELAEHVDILLQLLALWYRDMIYAMTDRHSHMVFPDQAEWISKTAWSRSIGSWVTIMESALTAARRIKAHVAPQLALEQFLVNVREG